MMEMSHEINELAAALAKAQQRIAPALKEAENLGFKNQKTGKASKYADLAAVWEACRAPLAENDLAVSQLPTDAEPGRIALTSILLHASGQYLRGTFSMPLMQNTPHGAGSALTYLRRYALAALVGVVADDDDDGNAASRPSMERGREASYQPPTEARTARPQPAPPPRPAPQAPDATPAAIRALWARARDLGKPTPPAHLTIDLETLAPEKRSRLAAQARQWIAQAEAAQPPAPSEPDPEWDAIDAAAAARQN
jgi:hypothetical protein